MKVLIASDSYKGSLNTSQVADLIRKGVLKVFPDAETICMTVADGGEGTAAAIIEERRGRFEKEMVIGPDGKYVEAQYGLFDNNKAVIEMAAASGLPLVSDNNIMKATTYGTGQLIKAALDKGCREIFIGIGGSATNDCGIGMAQALGISFTDKNGEEAGYGGGELGKINKIDFSGRDPRIEKAKIIVMCDVTNPLCGKNGAAAVYGPQKGATKDQIRELDDGLKHVAELIKETTGLDVENMEGAGAAGGMGAGLVAFLNAKICSGIETILDTIGFEKKLMDTDIVITGEGKIDSQSVCGKVLSGICKKAEKKSIPVIAVAGAIGKDAKVVYQSGVYSMESAVCRPMCLEEAIKDAEDLVVNATERIMRAVKVGLKIK